MKKIFSLIAVLVLLSGCDDGEMSIKTFDFDNGADPAWCGEDGLYKIVGTEVLKFTFDKESAFPNTDDPEVLNVPRTITIGGTINTITYLNYNANVTASDVCRDGADDNFVITDPLVIDTWTATGTVTVITTRTVNSGVITFNHTIELTDLTFTKDGEEEIRIQQNNFGSVATTRGFDFDFDFEADDTTPLSLRQCSSDSPIYKRKEDEALQLTLPNTVYAQTTDIVTLNIASNLDEYIVDFWLYDGNVTDNKMCNANVATPVELQHWVAEEGTIRIEPTLDQGVWTYKIVLIDAVFYKQGTSVEQTFVPANTTGENGYLFGNYSPE